MARYDHASIAEKLKQVVAFTEFSAAEIDKLVVGGKILFFKKDTRNLGYLVPTPEDLVK